MPKQKNLLEWAIEVDRRLKAAQQSNRKVFIENCRQANINENATLDDAMVALAYVRRMASGQDIHTYLLELIKDVENGME